MTEMQKRALERKKRMTIKKTYLHSPKHNSFHFELSDSESFALLRKMSLKKWEHENKQKVTQKVDKTKCKIISLKDK